MIGPVVLVIDPIVRDLRTRARLDRRYQRVGKLRRFDLAADWERVREKEGSGVSAVQRGAGDLARRR